MTGATPLRLPAPRGGAIDLLVVAGEHSGDEHAARMVAGLLSRRPGARVAALGGPRLAAAGAQLLHDRTELSIVGFADVLRNLPYFRSLIEETVRWIGRFRPSAVCLVDNSGVNLRLAEALRMRGFSAKGGGSVRTLYYISPQIWASRAGRRFEMARNLDALAVIFPFEPQCYEDTGLQVEFVGHPFMAPDYAPPVRYDPDGPVLLLPGSRLKAVARIFPVLLGGYREFERSRPGRGAVVLYPSAAVRAQLEAVPPPDGVRLQQTGSPVAASAVLTSSGTMSMHCALAGIPGAIAYRADPFTYFLGRWIVRVPFLGIANILLGEPMYPEFIQSAATPGALARELASCADDPARRARTAAQCARLRAMLARRAADTEADWLLRNLP
ncbi:MAG TPA: lipid-A-disaccharide synthase [Opitutaceae bacterium]|nr:lipid-A-disaccharide synthase [Opitutaceae bacterium]